MISTSPRKPPNQPKPPLRLIEYRSIYRLLFFGLIVAIVLRLTLDSLHDMQYRLANSDFAISEAFAFYRLHDWLIPSNNAETQRKTALLFAAVIAPGIWWLFSLSSHPKTADRLGPYVALATTHMATGFFMTFMLGSFGWVMTASFFLPLRSLQAFMLIFWKQTLVEATEPLNTPSSTDSVLVSRYAGNEPMSTRPQPVFVRDRAPRPVCVFLFLIGLLLALPAVHMNLFFWSITGFLMTHFHEVAS